jgi:hypothetical protein
MKKIHLQTVDEIVTDIFQRVDQNQPIVKILTDLILHVEKYNLLGVSKKRICIEVIKKLDASDNLLELLDPLIDQMVVLLNTKVKKSCRK